MICRQLPPSYSYSISICSIIPQGNLIQGIRIVKQVDDLCHVHQHTVLANLYLFLYKERMAGASVMRCFSSLRYLTLGLLCILKAKLIQGFILKRVSYTTLMSIFMHFVSIILVLNCLTSVKHLLLNIKNINTVHAVTF